MYQFTFRKQLQYDAGYNKTTCSNVAFLSEQALKIKTTIGDLLVCIIPLCIIIPTNIAIIVRLVNHRKFRQKFDTTSKSDETSKVTIMLMSVTVTYVILMLPMTVAMIIYNNSNPSTYYGMIIIMSNFPYLNMSANFYLYFFSGRMFRDKVAELFTTKSQYCCLAFRKCENTKDLQMSLASNAHLIKTDSQTQRSASRTHNFFF